MSTKKEFVVEFTYREFTTTHRHNATSTVEADNRDDARDIISGRWPDVRIRSVTEKVQRPLPHTV